MLKITKIVDDKAVKVGNFKSFVAFADWLDKHPKKNIGTYYSIPSNCTTLASMDRIIYDGFLCIADRRGTI